MTIGRRIIDHLFATAQNRDGQAAGLEREARHAPGLIAPDSLLADAALAQDVPIAVIPAVRPAPEETIRGVIARQVLWGWAENRTQILHPLTLNFSVLTRAQGRLLITVAKIALSTCGLDSPQDGARAAQALRSARASDDLLADLDAPMAGVDLATVLSEAREGGLAGHAYATVMAVSDQRDPVSRAFANFVRLRLDLSEDVASGLARRYRR